MACAFALCWGYVLDEEAANALPICDRAVAMGAQEALHSRGIAYAETGDLRQAGEDLRAFLEWVDQQGASNPYRFFVPQVDTWLTALDRGENPVTPEVLSALRRE